MWGLKSREEGRMGHLRILQEYYIIYGVFLSDNVLFIHIYSYISLPSSHTSQGNFEHVVGKSRPFILHFAFLTFRHLNTR